MMKSVKHIDKNLLSAKREWKAFALKRNREGAWDMVEMSLPTHVIDQFQMKINRQNHLGQIVNKIRTSIAKHAQGK